MSNALHIYPAGGASNYYATWLGPSAPRIAATCGAAPLPVLVDAVLAELTAAGRSFTAYDVTMVLRAVLPYPQRDLPHYDQHGVAGVQPEVRRQMDAYLTGGDYTTRMVYPRGQDAAVLYMPAQPRPQRGLLSLLARRRSAAIPAGAWVVAND